VSDVPLFYFISTIEALRDVFHQNKTILQTLIYYLY